MSDQKDNNASKRKTRAQSQTKDGAGPVNPEKTNTNFVSLETVKQLLKDQESSLRSIFESTIQSMSKRLDDVVVTVSEIKKSLEYSQKDIEELEPLRKNLDEAHKEIDVLEYEFKNHDLKLEYLENQSRRNNIRVRGIPESKGETWDQVETKLKAAIKTKLGMDVDIERAHRVERRMKSNSSNTSGGANASSNLPNQPRVIVCRMRDWKQREAVIRKARKEKPTNLFICEDLALATLKKREPKIEEMKAAKKAGKLAYFVLDRLIIKNKPTAPTI